MKALLISMIMGGTYLLLFVMLSLARSGRWFRLSSDFYSGIPLLLGGGVLISAWGAWLGLVGLFRADVLRGRLLSLLGSSIILTGFGALFTYWVINPQIM